MGKIILNDIEYGVGVSNGSSGSNIDTTNLVEKDSIVTEIDSTCTDEQIPSAKLVYDKFKSLPIDKCIKCYTSLTELELTADATIDDVISKLESGECCLLKTSEFTNYLTMFPNDKTEDKYAMVRIEVQKGGKVILEWRQLYGYGYAIGGVSGNNKFTGSWKKVALLSDVDAIKDTLGLNYNGKEFKVKIKRNGQNLYGNLKFSYVYDGCPTEVDITVTSTVEYRIAKGENSISSITYTTDTNYITFGIVLNYTSYGIKTIEMPSEFGTIDSFTAESFTGDSTATLNVSTTKNTYRIITQATAGYFKFKPCANPKEQGIRISVTDNYGGMIDISGVTPTSTQYKPFKCVRLSNGAYANYDAKNTTNNKMQKLFYFDGYMYLQVTTYTTVTFVGLIEEPTLVETIDVTAEEIPIVSVFDATQYDDYGDPYIVTVGDAVSADGSIQTLDSLGLSTDILTWKTGIYKVSHVSGLTNLPSDITVAQPAFRLEHHNIKKWTGGHKPSTQTWAQRHSIIYCDNGDIYTRFYESGATAGTYIKDTGWRKIATDVSRTYTTLDELGLTAPVSIGEVFLAMPDKTTLMLNVENVANANATVTDAPHNQGVLVINKHSSGRFSIEFNYSLGGNGDTIRKWIGTLKGNDGTGLNWKEVAYSNDYGIKSYGSLTSLGLDTTATINDIISAMANNSIFMYKTDAFDYANEYNNLQYATVTIHKQSANRAQVLMTDKDTGNLYVAKSNSTNQIVGWNKLATETTYSTNEVAIGTWIDGKTIYRKTYVNNAPAPNSNGNFTETIATGVTKLISAKGTVSFGASAYTIPAFMVVNSTVPTYATIFLNSSGYVFLDGVGSNLSNISVTIEYTK